MNGFATAIISVLLLVVAFLQWRTAHQKVVLDLFDRRLKVYEAVVTSVETFFSGPSAETVTPARQAIYDAYAQSRFLFGDEVSQAILDISSDMFELNQLVHTKDAEGISVEMRNQLIENIMVIDGRLNGWRRPFTHLCNPYLRMDQKRVRTPAEWFRDRNQIRKSYGDQN